MKNEIPLVSIICLAYNHEKYILDALEGFIMQKTDFAFEVLIHDDASTDKTADIIREYEAKYPDIIKPIYQTENQYSKKVKIGKKYLYPRAKGKYIALCEGDDYWIDPLKLQKQVDFMNANNECSLCFHDAHVLLPNGKEKNIITFYENKWFSLADIVYGVNCKCFTASSLFRKEYIDEFPNFKCNVGDYPLWIYLAIKGNVYYMNEKMGVYRMFSANSWSINNLSSGVEKKIEAIQSQINLMNDYDVYTDGKYSAIFQQVIRNRNLKILLFRHDYFRLKEYRAEIRKMGLKKIVSIYLQSSYYLRWVYSLYIYFKTNYDKKI